MLTDPNDNPALPALLSNERLLMSCLPACLESLANAGAGDQIHPGYCRMNKQSLFPLI